MKIIRNITAVAGLSAIALSLFAGAPVHAQGFHPFRNGRMHHATRLDREADRAAARGNYRKASKLRAHAARLRHTRYGL